MQVGVYTFPINCIEVILCFILLTFSHNQQGCVPGVGIVSASSSSSCSSEVACPLCGKSVYSSVANPYASTIHDMQSSISIHIIRECSEMPCSIGSCRCATFFTFCYRYSLILCTFCSWKGGYSHLPLHIATAHSFM